VRGYDVEKLMQIQQPMDIFLSHDWPRGIERFGDLRALLRVKKYFYGEVSVAFAMMDRVAHPSVFYLFDRL
jgi:hypothetical protein